MKLKSTCCQTYKKKGKACRKCPVMARLSKKKRLKKLRKAKKSRH